MNTQDPDYIAKQFGRNLQELRRSRKWTLAQLSEKSGIPKSTLAHFESGSGNPALDKLTKLALTFGVSADELILVPATRTVHMKREDMPEFRVPGSMKTTVTRILPDPHPGFDYYFIEMAMNGFLPGILTHRKGLHTVFCTEGGLDATVEGDPYKLTRGEALGFLADTPFTLRNRSNARASVLMVVSHE
jgi:transcriptional regulator with XRE-family HTH domain